MDERGQIQRQTTRFVTNKQAKGHRIQHSIGTRHIPPRHPKVQRLRRRHCLLRNILDEAESSIDRLCATQTRKMAGRQQKKNLIRNDLLASSCSGFSSGCGEIGTNLGIKSRAGGDATLGIDQVPLLPFACPPGPVVIYFR